MLDATGGLAGILLPPPDDPARLLPPGVAEAARAAALAPVLAAAGLPMRERAAAGALPPEDIAGLADAMTVLVSCWR